MDDAGTHVPGTVVDTATSKCTTLAVAANRSTVQRIVHVHSCEARTYSSTAAVYIL